jgi:hypothetical protein
MQRRPFVAASPRILTDGLPLSARKQERAMRLGHIGVALVALAALVFPAALAAAAEFRLTEVRALSSAAQPAAHVILFTDHRDDELAEPATGLMRFDEWARAMATQRQFLNIYPGYVEPTVNVTANGVTKPAKERLHVYVAEARFVLAKPAQSIDLTRYTTLAVLERIDPAIKEKLVTQADVAADLLKNPNRPWCETKPTVICIASHYDLEGKLPMGVHLANQLVDSKKKIADYLEFHSELRVLKAGDLDQAGLATLTGIDGPVAIALEQSIFHVNQIMQFGKFLAVFQQDSAKPDQTIVTAYIALAIKSRVLESKKKYENVPVLRNLVPAQVLMGKSSFNTGTSISAGLPSYARNRIKAIASLLDEG